jgi:hypothetical protein
MRFVGARVVIGQEDDPASAAEPRVSALDVGREGVEDFDELGARGRGRRRPRWTSGPEVGDLEVGPPRALVATVAVSGMNALRSPRPSGEVRGGLASIRFGH